MTEASKILDSILPVVTGKSVLELGCGGGKLVDWAVAVDRHSAPCVDMQADVSPGSAALQNILAGKQFDVVFSSHVLEHIREPVLETLRYWFSFVKPSGWLILYLPDERYYVFDPGHPLVRNPEHHHLLTADTFQWYVQQLAPQGSNCRISMDVGPSRYSFLVFLQKM
jgi:predicted SAM-dependent methyltransferase